MLRADVDQRRPVAYLDRTLPIAFAHRGGAAHQPENSWAAFEHAIGLGYTHLETDARATSDGVLLAFHDRTLDRVTDRTGRIARMSYRDVAGARIGGTEAIPLIEDLLGTWPGLRFNIDLKDVPAIRPMMDVLRRTRAWDRVLRHVVLGAPAARGPGAARPPGLHGAVPGRGGHAAAHGRHSPLR